MQQEMIGHYRATNDEIVIVGVCAAGKSTLANRLRAMGLRARTVAQEHSGIPNLWQQSGASTVIYLHASFRAIKRRRNSLMHQYNYDAQLHRLRSARTGATISVDTSELTSEQVYDLVARQLATREESEPPVPVPDEPGMEGAQRRAVSVPVPNEPGESEGRSPYKDLPVPEEL